jgi:hypothetical protein
MASSSTALKLLQIAPQYWTYAGSITFIAGIIGSVINVLVFTHLKFFRNNQCIFYLTIESISDFFYQFFSISLTILISIYGNDLTDKYLIWCKLKYFLTQSFTLITLTMTCFEAADQFFSTSYRFHLRQTCTLQLLQRFVFIIICVWLLHSLLCSFFVNIVPSMGCIEVNQIWIRYVTLFFYPILMGFFPIVIVSTFSLLAFRNVRRIIRRQIPIQRRRLDHQITAMVLLRVVLSVCFGLPYVIYRLYVINVPKTQANLLNFAIEQLVQAMVVSIVNLNFSVEFSLYFVKMNDSIPFRQTSIYSSYHHHDIVVK